MFELLKEQPADNILALMGMYASDKRTDKLDLGVGVYRNSQGLTPVMDSVKRAENALLKKQISKSYVGLLGNLDFVMAMKELILSNSIPDHNFVGAQAPGGTGSLHQLFLLLKLANPELTVWISNPTWPNHSSMLKHLGLNFKYYRYFSEDTGSVDFDAMIADLRQASRNDVILIHGCCHNPTGANLTVNQWNEVSQLCETAGVMPMIDLAYQGFGRGLNEDVEGLRLMASSVPELAIAASCSKNFGIYRDRVGVALYCNRNAQILPTVSGNLKAVNRLTYSFPPDWGATVVSMILRDKNLRQSWDNELNGIKDSINTLRLELKNALQRSTKSDRFAFLTDHTGMFSRLGLSKEQVISLRQEHAVYMVGDSRINIAGLNSQTVEVLSNAVSKVI